MSILGIASKVFQRYEEQGVEHAVKSLLDDAKQTVIEHREVIIMTCDLSNKKAHPTEKDKARHELVLHDFGPEWVDRCKAMLEASEPYRLEQLELRIKSNCPGFVITEGGEIVAYLFYEHNSPDRPAHSDLEWLRIDLKDDECYCFDSYIPPALRGRGIPMQRRVYFELFQRGFKRARGFCNAWDTAPLWSYRVTGWTEDFRITEYRLFGNKIAVVGDGVYKVNPFDRNRIGTIPGPEATASS